MIFHRCAADREPSSSGNGGPLLGGLVLDLGRAALRAGRAHRVYRQETLLRKRPDNAKTSLEIRQLPNLPTLRPFRNTRRHSF